MVSTSERQPANGGRGRERLTSIRVPFRARPWLTSPRQNQIVVISMKAVRRAARAVKRIHNEQTLMWEGFWRASRFPVD
jgi:hypothetical protein